MERESARPGSSGNAPAATNMQNMIEQQWRLLPKGVRAFLLETPLHSLDLRGFVNFYTGKGGIFTSMREASFLLALGYNGQRKMREARALMLNGSFIIQCMATPMKTIIQWCQKDANPPQAQLFSQALKKKSQQEIEAFITKMLHGFHDSKHLALVNLLDKTEDVSGNPAKKRQKPSTKTLEGTQVQLILADYKNTEERHLLNIGSSTTLKTLFNNYADKRGVSLRSLRFLHNGKPLFLSSAGNKTPDELNMRDQDMIIVHDTNIVPQGEDNGSSSTTKKNRPATKKHATKHSKLSKKIKAKKKKEQSNRVEAAKTVEDYKTHHSKLLSKLHEEVQPQLKEIRMKLNALSLERQAPKKKRTSKKKNKAKGNIEAQMVLPNSGVGGKAGKAQFVVQVGEVENLYKTAKMVPQKGLPCNAHTILDLHSYMRDEALAKLDENLVEWVDIAMRGSYPFVIPVRIVCGCGGQILSETVEKWIRRNAQVANCPKGIF